MRFEIAAAGFEIDELQILIVRTTTKPGEHPKGRLGDLADQVGGRGGERRSHHKVGIIQVALDRYIERNSTVLVFEQ